MTERTCANCEDSLEIGCWCENYQKWREHHLITQTKAQIREKIRQIIQDKIDIYQQDDSCNHNYIRISELKELNEAI
jgi:hypothetical protein